MILKMYVKRYAWNPTTKSWSATGTELTDCYDVTVSSGTGNIKDVFSFKIKNVRDSKINNIVQQDRIEIYYLINNAAASTDNLIINGIVKDVKENITSKDNHLFIEGVSYSEIITNALVFIPESSKTVYTMVQSALNSVNTFDKLFNLTLDMPLTKRDLSSYPVITDSENIREYNKSLSYILDKYLKDEYTGDGNYYYYVSTDKKLVIRPKKDGTAKSITEGTDILSCKMTNDTSAVKNFIVVKCGYDYNNRVITTRYDDVASRAKNGFRYYMLVDHNIAGKYKQLFPLVNSAGNPWGTTNDQFRAFIKEGPGKEAGRIYAVNNSDGKLKINIMMAPNLNFLLGDRINLNIPSYNLVNELVRITDVSYDLNNTSYTLEEEV